MARLNEKVKDLENKLKRKDHELEMITSQANEDVATKTRSLQEEMKKCEEQKRKTEDELAKVQRELSRAQHQEKEDHTQLNKQVRSLLFAVMGSFLIALAWPRGRTVKNFKIKLYINIFFSFLHCNSWLNTRKQFEVSKKNWKIYERSTTRLPLR